MLKSNISLTCCALVLLACGDASMDSPFAPGFEEGGSGAAGSEGAVEAEGTTSTDGMTSTGGTTSGPTSNGGTTSPGVECTNIRPTGTMWDAATCDQWASETTECNQPWMIENNYCNESCGRCTPGSSGGSAGSEGTPTTTGATPIEVHKFVGNITTNNQADASGLRFATHWDQITPENAGKWGSVQPAPQQGYNWSTLDALYDYAEDNGIIFKQHAFVWGRQQPSGSISEQNVKDWIQSFCARYPNTQLIDVVNEPPPHTEPTYVDSIGGGTNGDWQWITNSFVWAREFCPNSILILNDFNNIEWPTDNQHFIDITNTVLANGGPIDAIGAQAHDLDHEAVSTPQVKQLIQKLHDDTGLDVYITEYDISTADDAQQLSLYQEHIPYFMETEFIKGITIWGWIYGQTWDQAPQSGLIRDGSPRPAMAWLMETLSRPVP